MLGRKESADTIRIDPRMFISKPYIKCPRCSKQEFGVLLVRGRRYTRRCGGCRYTQTYDLPHLKKRVIYLDQMAISDMMKLLHPKVKAEKKDRIKPIWKNVFEKLDRLVKLQLIICPDSNIHRRESLVMAGCYKPLKRMYEQLSNGVSFHDGETIKRFQISADFRRWLGKERVKEISVYDVTQGDLDGWQNRLRVSVDISSQDQVWPQLIKENRDAKAEDMAQVFERWQLEKTKKFQDWYEEERSVFGPTILGSYFDGIFEEDQMRPTLVFPLFSSASVTMAEIHKYLREQGLSDEDVLMKSVEYMRSDTIKEIPYVRISASMYAAMARKAASGQRRLPTRGVLNDVEMLATLAPYCNTMFIDNVCHALLNEHVDKEPITEFLGLGTLFFSQSNMDEFLEYLDQIETSANEGHLEKVKEVYGETWGKPFVGMYNYEP